MTLVRPFSRVAASVDDQIALEFENLAAELTGFGFPQVLVLDLAIGRAGRTMSALGGGWLRGVGEKWRGLGTRLEKCRTQQAVHRRHAVG